MKTAACIVLLSVIFAQGLLAQTKAATTAASQPREIRISAGVAEKLLIHKAMPVLSPEAMEAHGTVVVVIEIGINGDVRYSKVISGPAILRKPVLDAVRKYKYKPYLLNNNAVEVQTTVSVTLNQ